MRRRDLMAAGLAAISTGCTARTDAPLLDSPTATSLAVMDFAPPFELAPLPPGFVHRTFWTRAPMTMQLAVRDGRAALRCETRASASMLIRHTDLAIAARRRLAWQWLVEVPIESHLDERTQEGDDHPARLYLAFRAPSGARRAMEIIWGNRVLQRGDWKYRGSFPHYVANGGMANVGRWHTEEVDLQALVSRAWPDDTPTAITEIGVFCDSDETRTRSVAWFAGLGLAK